MIIALFLSNLCLGIVARTVPQVNILMVGFPVNICIGLVFLIFTFSNMTPFMEELFRKIGEAMMALIRLM
jgi:flagellar biosynthetic protein FliR